MAETQGYASFPKPEEFLIDVPLYAQFAINPANWGDVLRMEYYCGPLESFCVECGRGSVFRAAVRMPHLPTTAFAGADDVEDFIETYDYIEVPELGMASLALSDYAARDREIRKCFTCAIDPDHDLTFYLLVRSSRIMKVGQYPTLADLQSVGLREYSKVLGKARYAELNRAVGLSAHGVGIGAFVYLRRIFEHLVELAHDKARQESGWDENLYLNTRMDEKIDLLKALLPPFLVQNRGAYSILSKGIHSLTEEECLQHFSIVRSGVELILDELVAQEERDRKTAQAKADLDALKRKLG